MSIKLIYPGEGSLVPKQKVNQGQPKLNVSELFTDTIQGEGLYAGTPATFLRLAGCPVNCKWCDSRELWTKAKTFGIPELVDIFAESVVGKLLFGKQHLVVTGGSPLLQQQSLVAFLNVIMPSSFFIELENEASIPIVVEKGQPSLVDFVTHWNLSPKLSNSGIDKKVRYNEEALKQFRFLSRDSVSFKFVVSDPEKDWEEIWTDFIKPNYATEDQIILMPKGCSQVELTAEVKERTVELAVQKGVKYGSRLHIDIWDRKTSV